MLKKFRSQLIRMRLDKSIRLRLDQPIILIDDVYREILEKIQTMHPLVEARKYSELKGYIQSLYAYIDMLKENIIFYRDNIVEELYDEFDIKYDRSILIEQENRILGWIEELKVMYGDIIASYSYDNKNVDKFLGLFFNFNDLLINGNVLISGYMNSSRCLIMEYRIHEMNLKRELGELNYILKELKLEKKIYEKCKELFVAQNYNLATLNVFMLIETESKKMSNIEVDIKLQGTDLFNKILSSDKPLLFTETKKEGAYLREFIKSSFCLFRNPLAHDKGITLTKEESIERIIIANYIYKTIKTLSKKPTGEWAKINQFEK